MCQTKLAASVGPSMCLSTLPNAELLLFLKVRLLAMAAQATPHSRQAVPWHEKALQELDQAIPFV